MVVSGGLPALVSVVDKRPHTVVDVACLSDAERTALSNEFFAHWEAETPGLHHGFCGSDEDLVRLVAEIRAERERANDDEIGG